MEANSSNCCRILNWNDKRETALVWSSINICFLTMWITGLSLLSLVSNILIFLVVVSLIVVKFSHQANERDKDCFEKVFKCVYGFFICCEDYMRKVVSFENPIKTVQFYVGIYLFSWFTSLFCDCFLLFVAVNALFLWQPVYNAKRSQIDGLVGTVKALMNHGLMVVESKIPRFNGKE